jgi:hypothetical protein
LEHRTASLGNNSHGGRGFKNPDRFRSAFIWQRTVVVPERETAGSIAGITANEIL